MLSGSSEEERPRREKTNHREGVDAGERLPLKGGPRVDLVHNHMHVLLLPRKRDVPH